MPTFSLCAFTTSLLVAAAGTTYAQSWQWAAAPAGTGSADIYATAPDGNGSTVVAGQFAGTITLGATTLTSAGKL
ncbi:hypothetical protein [Hymenobacter algoricola]